MPGPTLANAETMEFDRRRLPRRPVAGYAMAVFTEGNSVGKLMRVELMDASWTGIGVRSQTPVRVGSSCSLVPEDSMWPRQVGIVLRCEKDEDGYRIGVQSKMAKAAA